MHTQNNLESSISVLFGDKISGIPSINLSSNLHFLSEKVKTLRANLSDHIGMQIPAISFIFEIESHDDGQILAQSLKNIAKESESIKNLKESFDVDVNIIGKANKAYIILMGEGVERFFKKNFHNIELQHTVENALHLQIQSMNNMKNIKELLLSKGTLGSFLDSLQVNLKIKRTEEIDRFLSLFLEPMLMDSPLSPELLLSSFNNFNLDVKLESSKFLEQFPTMAEYLEKKIIKNFEEIFTHIQKDIVSEMKFYLFHSDFHIDGSLMADNLHLVLDLLLA